MAATSQPLKYPHHNHDLNACAEPLSHDPLFMENVNDIANAMSEIMVVCGIHPSKARSTKSIIIEAFQFYDVKRHQFNVTEKEGICRMDIVCEFQNKCVMTYMEALLAYEIIKRSVKAFYHGTPANSIRNPVIEAVILKEQEYIWQHAAFRTNQLFERYEHIFYEAKQNYAQQIFRIYRKLHQRLRSRADPVIIENSLLRGCVKKVIIGTKSPPKLDNNNPKCVEKCKKIEEMKTFIQNRPKMEFPLKSDLYLSNSCENLFGSKKTPQTFLSINSKDIREEKSKNIDLNLPRCYQCNCPQLICDCHIERDTGLVSIDCSQGPYECQWFRIDQDVDPDPCIEESELHQCPVDCPTSESSSDLDEYEFCKCSEED